MIRLCEWCEEPFTITYTHRKYCSAEHREVATRPWVRIRIPRIIVPPEPRQPRQVKDENVRRPRPERCRLCQCGTILTDTTRRACDECKEQTRRTKERAKYNRRRMRMGVNQERYTLAEIAMRDANRCALCRKRVPMRMVVPHPYAPTIDHILPLSEGGDDTKANVQLAHFICNSTKAARAHSTDQLRLVG